MKASINGPNRRKNRAGDKTVISDFKTSANSGEKSDTYDHQAALTTLQFKVKSLEKYLEQNKEDCDKNSLSRESIGDACLFSVHSDVDENSCAGQELIHKHLQMTTPTQENVDQKNLRNSDPILIHFHDIPILIMKAIPVYSSYTNKSNKKNIIYLSQVHCHNHKICEDTVYSITCCSRMVTTETNINTNHLFKDYDNLSAIGFEVFLRYNITERDNRENNDAQSSSATCEEFNAKDINKLLIHHCLYSVLTVNECLVVSIDDKELVCRVSKVCIDRKTISEEGDDNYDDNEDNKTISAAEASLDDPYRGRVLINTDFYIETSNPDAIVIHGGRTLPESNLPEDVIHVTTSDDEWFPVRRILLATCINLTKYVQYGKGKYNTVEAHAQQREEKVNRSPDAPESGIHCRLNIDCCTFDRVLIFIMSQLYPDEYNFALELSETNALTQAAEELGLLSLSDLCKSQLSSFASRVRKDKYIRFNEIQKRNENNELLIIVDGMVLDITRWIEEHPGGPSIIPSQALNIDCTCFFEMYHVSSASFLYLKSFYIGELHPGTVLKKKDIKPSEGFLQSLRSYTDKWRVKIDEKVDETIHKSL